MSAWDIAGAVVWPLTAMASAGLGAAVMLRRDASPGEQREGLFGVLLSMVPLTAAILCWARLCGARA